MPCCKMTSAVMSYTPASKSEFDFSFIVRAYLPSLPTASSPIHQHLISVFGPHAQTRASRGCRSRGLGLLSHVRDRPPQLHARYLCQRTLDVTDDGTGGIVHELDANLSNTTARAGTAEDAYCPVSAKLFLLLQFDISNIRVTLTSLIGCLAVSMVADVCLRI